MTTDETLEYLKDQQIIWHTYAKVYEKYLLELKKKGVIKNEDWIKNIVEPLTPLIKELIP